MNTPIRTEHVVSPGLDMDVYVERFDSRQGPLEAWVFVTRGFSELHHRELVLAIRMRSGEGERDSPADVGQLYRAIYEAAGQGRTVDVGGTTSFKVASGRFLGRKDLGGVAYTWVPRSLEQISGRDALLAVVLTEHEMTVAREYGHTRVLSCLGERARFYPTPPWFDRDRKEVLRPNDMGPSLVGKMARLHLSRSTIFLTPKDASRKVVGGTAGMPDFEGSWSDGPVTLLLDPADVPRLKAGMQALPPEAVLALLTSVPPSIAHCMVWNPTLAASGQAAMISDYENRLDPRCAGNFLVLCGGQAASSMRGTEDGFALLLTDVDLGRAHRALAAGDSLTIDDANGGRLLEIRPVR